MKSFWKVLFLLKTHMFVGLLVMLGVEGSARATIIRPVSVLSEEYVYSSAVNTINNSGLSTTLDTGASLVDALNATHVYDGVYQQSFVTTNPGDTDDFYKHIGSDTDVDIVLDLTGGGDTDVRGLLLWQYQNNGGGTPRAGNALRYIEIRINTEAQGTNSFSGAAITLNTKPVIDGDTDDSNDLGGVNSAQAFNLGTQSGRYVLLSLTDNYFGLQGMTAGGDRVGFGEVRFSTEAIPEPAALTLVLCFGMGFIGLRRWFR